MYGVVRVDASSEQSAHKPNLLGTVSLHACYPALIISSVPYISFLLFPCNLLQTQWFETTHFFFFPSYRSVGQKSSMDLTRLKSKVSENSFPFLSVSWLNSVLCDCRIQAFKICCFVVVACKLRAFSALQRAASWLMTPFFHFQSQQLQIESSFASHLTLLHSTFFLTHLIRLSTLG